MEITAVGESGTKYTYTLFDLNTIWNDVPGNYMFVRQDKDGGIIAIYIGQTGSLKTRLTSDHEKLECANSHGMTHYLAHTNTGGVSVRLAEEQDLIEHYNPPCND